MDLGRDLPLELTFSCIAPVEGCTAASATSAPSAAPPSGSPGWRTRRIPNRFDEVKDLSLVIGV